MEVILRDDFAGNALDRETWALPAPGDSSFLGRTQLRLDEAPSVTDGVVRLRLDTFLLTNPNPPPGQIPAFLGSEIRTHESFDLSQSGYAWEARLRVENSSDYPLERGMVAAFFGYALNEFNSDLTLDKIDVEVLSK